MLTSAFKKANFGTSPTISITVTGTASASTAADTSGAWTQYRLVNSGSNITYIAIGSSTDTPVATTSHMPMLGNTVEVFTAQPNANFSAIGTTGNTLYITPGEGL